MNKIVLVVGILLSGASVTAAQADELVLQRITSQPGVSSQESFHHFLTECKPQWKQKLGDTEEDAQKILATLWGTDGADVLVAKEGSQYVGCVAATAGREHERHTVFVHALVLDPSCNEARATHLLLGALMVTHDTMSEVAVQLWAESRGQRQVAASACEGASFLRSLGFSYPNFESVTATSVVRSHAGISFSNDCRDMLQYQKNRGECFASFAWGPRAQIVLEQLGLMGRQQHQAAAEKPVEIGGLLDKLNGGPESRESRLKRIRSVGTDYEKTADCFFDQLNPSEYDTTESRKKVVTILEAVVARAQKELAKAKQRE